jgi:hypothetical protein
MATVLMWARRPLALCLGTGNFIKFLFPWTIIFETYALCSASDPFVEEGSARWLVEAERGWRHAGLLLLSILSGPRRAFGKVSIGGVLTSSPAWAPDDEVASRLLAQPALRLKSASLA